MSPRSVLRLKIAMFALAGIVVTVPTAMAFVRDDAPALERPLGFPPYAVSGRDELKAALNDFQVARIDEGVITQIQGEPLEPPTSLDRPRFDRPLSGSLRVTSPFGPRGAGFHHGTDIGCATGTPIHAVRAGRVIIAAEVPVYGNVVAIAHGSGYVTVYAHLSAMDVRENDEVATGEQIGDCGNTGNSTGPHLHFEVRHEGFAHDAMKFLP